MFMIPAAMGAGDHWKLDDSEANDVGAALQEALDTIPDSVVGKTAAVFGSIAPWLGLSMALVTVTYPRIMETQVNRALKAQTPGTDGDSTTDGAVLPLHMMR